MPAPIPVAILGFSTFDRKALASYFQLSGAARQRYAHVLNLDLADLVIADADEAGVLELLQKLGRVSDALFIGAAAPMNSESLTRPSFCSSSSTPASSASAITRSARSRLSTWV